MLARDAYGAFVRAIRIPARNGNGCLHRQPAHERVLSGVAHLAQDEERTILRDIDSYLRILDELCAEPLGDVAGDALCVLPRTLTSPIKGTKIRPSLST